MSHRRVWGRFFPPHLLGRQGARCVRQCFQRMDKAAFIDIMGAVMRCLHKDAAFRFPQPVLLLCGADDKSGNIRASVTAWAQANENGTLFMIEDAGHNANQDQPEAVNQHILDFL